MRLSNDRAGSCYTFLVQRGIDPGRMSFIGFGPNMPIADNNTDFGRQMNRRTEFIVVAR